MKSARSLKEFDPCCCTAALQITLSHTFLVADGHCVDCSGNVLLWLVDCWSKSERQQCRNLFDVGEFSLGFGVGMNTALLLARPILTWLSRD